MAYFFVAIRAEGEFYQVHTPEELVLVTIHIASKAKSFKCVDALDKVLSPNEAKDLLRKSCKGSQPHVSVIRLTRNDGQHSEPYYLAQRERDGKFMSPWGFFTEVSNSSFVEVFIEPEELKKKLKNLGYFVVEE